MLVNPLFISHNPCQSAEAALRLLQSRLACGFPSPAADYLEEMPSLDALLVKHPSATFFARAQGDSIIEQGISF